MSRPLRAAPPPPPSKPGHVKVMRAMYRYDAQQSDELSFDEGDNLYIIEMCNASWWRARCGNKEGLVPSNYVEESTESIDNPLHEAAKRGNETFMSECITNNVSVNGLDKAGSTPLHWAAHGGHIACIKMLLGVPNVTVNVQNKMGDTPLHSAAWKGHPEAVRMILAKGGRTDIRNKENKLPSDLAKDPETAAILKQATSTQINSEDYGDEEDSD